MDPVDHLPKGLASAEAAARLARDGPNQLSSSGRHTAWHQLKEVAAEPMFLLLLAAGGIYLLAGDPMEALALLGFVVIIIVVTTLQERRTERALDTLRDLSSPRALAVRDGQLLRIAGREVVVGDTLMLVEGDRVPADGRLLQAHELAIDESLLTGESFAVSKQADDGATDNPLAHAFAGTLIVAGQGWMEVTSTGARTEFGRIGQALAQVAEPPSPLQVDFAQLAQRLALVALLLCLMVIGLAYWRSGLALSAILAGITLGMALLPQEFPVILTVFLAMGARRMVSVGILTRHLQAIETLGQATALCVDKTGTLTENRMEVACLMAGDELLEVASLAAGTPLPETFHRLLEYAVLASEETPTDPMEQAFHRLGSCLLDNTGHLHPDWTLEREYEISPTLRAMSHGWRAEDLDYRPVATKGAPEAVAGLCHLTETEARRLARNVDMLASQGLRVLAVAAARQSDDAWPASQDDFDLTFLGLIGLADPLRPDVPAAIARCRAAGVKVYMMTGDHPSTAAVIARQAGLDSGGLLTGNELALLDAAAQAIQLDKVHVFARVSPVQKLALVEALKARGEVVAMTGDGVNDAPALKAAHIGIAMGQRGTDVARETASLVLVNDSFVAIVDAIDHGRRIYDNLKRAMLYTLAVHIPTIALTLVPLLLGLPAILLPLHIAFLELAIDPACSIVFESEPGRSNAMQRPPRTATEKLMSAHVWGIAMAAGLVTAVSVLAAYAASVTMGLSTDAVRSVSFVALVLANLALILGIRAPGPLTSVARRVMVATLAALALVNFVPVLAAPFKFAPLNWQSICLGMGAAGATYLFTRLLASRFDGKDRGNLS